MESVYLTQEGPVAGYCKHSDERSWPAERLSASQENCSLVTYSNFCFYIVYISNETCGLRCFKPVSWHVADWLPAVSEILQSSSWPSWISHGVRFLFRSQFVHTWYVVTWIALNSKHLWWWKVSKHLKVSDGMRSCQNNWHPPKYTLNSNSCQRFES